MVDNHTENWIDQEEIEPFHIAIILCAISLCCASLGNLMPCFQGVIEGKIAAHVIISAIDGETEPGGELEHELCGGLEIKDLSFRYPSRPDQEVLTSLSLTVRAGQTTALVGESGSGKSTVMALLLNYYAPTQGSISFDGVNSAKLSLKSLRSQMSLVSQEPLLFNLSIRENIRLGNLSATPSEILRAAEQTGVLGYAAKLPKGLDTLVGAKGSFLSGGQKQRIAIARALLKNPKILLLDEATSSLDNKTEALISETLMRLGKDRTTIMVAQRLKTVVHADQILVMRAGRLVEQGCHSDLMSIEGGVYHGMFRKQNPSTKVEVEAKLEDLELPAPQVPTKDLSLRRKHKALSILKLLRGTWLVFGLACFFCVCAGLTFPAFGYYVGEAIYYLCAEDGDDMLDEVYQASMALLVVCLVTITAIAINNLCLCYVATKFLIKVRQSAFASMLHYDQAYMDSSPTRISKLTTILMVQAEKLYALGGPIVGVFLIVVASLVCGAALNMWLNWDLGVAVTAVLPLMVLGLLRGFVQLTSLTNVDYASNFHLASDVFLNVKQVYAFNLQDYFLELYMKNSAALIARAKDQSYESSMLYGLQILSFFYALAFTYWYGAWLVKEQNMSYEDIIVTVFVQFMSCLGVSVASAVASDLTSGKTAIKGVFNKIDRQPLIDSYGRTGETPALSGKLSFVNVVFRYPNRDFPVLQSINFTLQPGQSLGICGSTGSGKSTLAAMMLRLYDSESGAVHYDNFDVKALNVRHLRSFVGWVPQEAVLFEGDLRFNLKLSKPDATDAEIIEALRAAQALPFIQEKGGLDAVVAFRGQNFSGGQKQRLALARGFLRKPALMILDEGTSALDSLSEGLVLEEVKQLRCSVVNIAHRLQTIQHCDHIIVLEQGSIIEEGSHEQLTMKQGVYYDLIRSGC